MNEILAWGNGHPVAFTILAFPVICVLCAMALRLFSRFTSWW